MYTSWLNAWHALHYPRVYLSEDCLRLFKKLHVSVRHVLHTRAYHRTWTPLRICLSIRRSVYHVSQKQRERKKEREGARDVIISWSTSKILISFCHVSLIFFIYFLEFFSKLTVRSLNVIKWNLALVYGWFSKMKNFLRGQIRADYFCRVIKKWVKWSARDFVRSRLLYSVYRTMTSPQIVYGNEVYI